MVLLKKKGKFKSIDIDYSLFQQLDSPWLPLFNNMWHTEGITWLSCKLQTIVRFCGGKVCMSAQKERDYFFCE